MTNNAERDPTDGDTVGGEVGAAVHEFVGRLDAVDAIHVGESLQPVDHQVIPLVTDDRIDGAHGPDDGLELAAELTDNGGNFGELGRSETVGFRQDHDGLERRSMVDTATKGQDEVAQVPVTLAG